MTVQIVARFHATRLKQVSLYSETWILGARGAIDGTRPGLLRNLPLCRCVFEALALWSGQESEGVSLERFGSRKKQGNREDK